MIAAASLRHTTRPLRRCRWVHSSQPRPSEVQIVEVGPRDGLQNEPQPVSVAHKVQLIEMLAQAGCTRIEPGSFVSPQAVPAMADTPAVMEALTEIRKQHKLQLSCLVPNTKYLEQALRYQPDEIAIFASASEAFSQKNINCSIDESIERFHRVVEHVQAQQTNNNNSNHLPIRGYLSCVIACPYQGVVPPDQVARLTERLLGELGCYEVSLGDTIGVGTPASTAAMLDAVLAVTTTSPKALAVHFHDT